MLSPTFLSLKSGAFQEWDPDVSGRPSGHVRNKIRMHAIKRKKIHMTREQRGPKQAQMLAIADFESPPPDCEVVAGPMNHRKRRSGVVVKDEVVSSFPNFPQQHSAPRKPNYDVDRARPR
jgi:hypothetical protein